MSLSIRGAATLLLFAAACPATAQTTDTPPDANPAAAGAETQQQAKPPTTLTGEWGGLRTKLRDDGVDLTAAYVSEFGANVSGGARKDATETGQFAFGATLDTAKLVGLEGGTVQATVTFRRGHNLTDRAGLGLLQQAQEVYGRGQTWRLTELWYQQDLGGGVDIKLGRLPQGADFNSFSCDFMNLSFCGAPAGNLAGDYWYNWPVAQWGARLRLKHDSWYVMAGAYENNPNNLDNAFFVSRGGATGVLATAETGWTPRLGASGLPGSYRIGGWYNTSNADDVLLGVDRRPSAVTGLDPLRRDGRYGGYILLQQQISGTATVDAKGQAKTKRGLTVFFNVTQTDRTTQRTDNQVALGLFATGLLAIRPQDDIGLGLARTNVNGRAVRGELIAAPGTEGANSEYAAELFYSAHLTPWLILRPNVQWVKDPGGYAEMKDVVVLGMKSAITF
ncbi:carbohydrate porin [Sphingomonas sp. BIUV-7]|uniref:Carbohydrate porin n=1 Tax=Sphingomonas natans TaxID=3063330 RepID=A0ABT8Y420_9SPHN|nr:carbohydrate porin [Sphingomonas sp. BIUV-7]MDO6413059.1 carbohydrate porin [Sphingomonas sp. BIUV-7]